MITSTRKHLTQTHLVKYPSLEAFKEDIQKSLVRDFRNTLLRARPCPRSHVDKICKYLTHMSVTELTLANKALSSQLASQPDGGSAFMLGDLIVPLDGDADRIRGLRQTLGFFSRLHANVTEEQKIAQLKEAADRLARPAEIRWTDPEIWVMRKFIRSILGSNPPDMRELHFRHGPGAVATREKGFEKLYFKETYCKVDSYLGYDSEFLLRLPNQPYKCLERTIPRTRVIAVPKDALRIRTISCEPLTMMFFQQGIMDYMYTRMFGRNSAGIGMQNFPFENQALQQRRARSGSYCSSWARPMQQCCIDLSNASDDVKCSHITLLFPPRWADLLMAFRSEEAHFEELDEVVTLQTYAPMGAAPCFPVESLVFGSIMFAGRFFSRGLRDPEGDWGVVGDDMCQPAYAYPLTLDLLDRGSFLPNLSKCCGPQTRFRESCGGDYYEGEDVTYVRPRFLSMPSYKATAPMVQMANGLAQRGFRITAQTIASATPGFVALGEQSPYADRRLKWPVIGHTRWNRGYQRYEQKAVVEKPLSSTRLGAVDGWEPLFNWFTSGWRSTTSFSSKTKSSTTWLEQPDGDGLLG